MSRIGFDSPLWLLALALVPLVVVTARRGLAAVRIRQHRIATWMRAAAIALLVIAVAGPRWEAAGRTVDVAFLIDASDSVGTAPLAALDWIRDAVQTKEDADRVAIALFGRDARLEHSLREDPLLDGVATIVDGSATDIARALRLGQGVLGSEHRRRVVLFTDGRETQGDVLRTVEELAAAGVAVDVVPLASGAAADVLVEEVIAPSRVREGEAYDVVGVLRNTGDSAADVVVVTTKDGIEVDRRTVSVEPGRSEVDVPQVAEDSGTVRYEVRIASGASTIADNDAARSATQIQGPPKVLVYEAEAGLGADLARALDAASIPVDRINAATTPLPPLDRLLDYEAVVAVDVPATTFGEEGMLALDAYVRDAGRGFVAVGGDDSYGMGEYDGTLLEELLPVFARVKDPKRRPNVAEALVVDVSGSMAACHCRGEGFGPGGGEAIEGGVNKTDITKEAIARAVRALEAQDLVGVLAFNATAEWVIPLQHLPDDAVVDGALARLRPDGPTNVVDAIRAAIVGLKDADARLRHIVLFTDGFSENPDMVEVAREAAQNGITLSVVATGEGTGEVLRKMADAGGGRYYPGRDLFSIPDIIVNEVQFVARPIINEGMFFPVVTGNAPATEDLTSTPPLLGYLATTDKPTAQTLLRIGEERDPLLATWQAGLGRTVAWTSDVAARWSAQWISWERYSTFWAAVVRSTFPAETDARFSLQASSTTEGLRITVEAADTVPTDANGTATVTTPDGERVEVDLQRTSLNTYEALVPGGGEGVYAVAVRLQRNGADLYRDVTTAIRSYSPEYAVASSDPDLLQRVAERGNGRFEPEPAVAFSPEGLAPGASSRALWPWFAALGLLLLPIDVGLRRLRLERGDLRRLRRSLAAATIPGRREREVAERSDVTGGLFEARRRAREGATARDDVLARPPAGPPADPQVTPSGPPSTPAPAAPPPPAAAPAPEPPPTPPRAEPPARTPPTPTRGPGPAAEPPVDPPSREGVGGLLDAKRRAREQRGDDA